MSSAYRFLRYAGTLLRPAAILAAASAIPLARQSIAVSGKPSERSLEPRDAQLVCAGSHVNVLSSSCNGASSQHTNIEFHTMASGLAAAVATSLPSSSVRLLPRQSVTTLGRLLHMLRTTYRDQASAPGIVSIQAGGVAIATAFGTPSATPVPCPGNPDGSPNRRAQIDPPLLLLTSRPTELKLPVSPEMSTDWQEIRGV